MFGNYKNKLKEWVVENSDKRIARVVLNIISFTESSFFPIPVDPFLATLILIKPSRWFKLVVGVTFWSVVGGIFGYLIGLFFFDSFGVKFIEFYDLAEEFAKVEYFFVKYGFWSVFIAAFTPIPYKIFTIAAGLWGFNLIIFIVASIIGRGLRFLIVGFLFRYIGEKYSEVVLKYFNWVGLVLGLLIIFYLVFKFI